VASQRLQTTSRTIPCESRLQKWGVMGKHPDGICGLCKRSREMVLGLLGGRPSRSTTGYLQRSVWRLQAPVERITPVSSAGRYTQGPSSLQEMGLCLERHGTHGGNVLDPVFHSQGPQCPSGGSRRRGGSIATSRKTRWARQKEWLETLKTFGINTEDGKKIIYRLGGTLLSEHDYYFVHEKLFCSNYSVPLVV